MKKTTTNQSGFSLLELLVVVIIIGIIAAIAIPSLLSSRRAANEASAVSNLRTIHTANATFAATQNDDGYFAGGFSDLSSAPGLLDGSWTGTPTKNTFLFTYQANSAGLTDDTTTTVDESTLGDKYCVTATSSDAQAKDFGVSTDGTIYEADNKQMKCTAGALDTSVTGFKVKGS